MAYYNYVNSHTSANTDNCKKARRQINSVTFSLYLINSYGIEYTLSWWKGSGNI